MLKDIINDKEKLNLYLEDIHGFDFANEFNDLNKNEKKFLFANTNPLLLATLIEYLDTNIAAKELSKLEENKIIQILDETSSDDKVDIIKVLDVKIRRNIINKLKDKELIKNLLLYTEDQTGAYTNYDVIKVNENTDVKDATKKLIKDAPFVESISTIFVVDNNNNYLGVVSFKSLIKAKTPMLIKDIMENLNPALITDDINDTIADIKNYKIYEMPVVDNDNKLVGLVSLDDAIDIAQNEAQEDFEKLAILPNTKTENIFKTAFHRIPWLIILAFLAVPIALLKLKFPASITGIFILTLFEPLILNTPGNIATQTLAVTLTELSDNKKIKFKLFLKEFISALLTALILALVAFIIAFIFNIIKEPSIDNTLINNKYLKASVIGAILSSSLFIVIILAPIIAILIPVFLKLIKIDPAVASGPFITTIIDVTSVSIYFTLAYLLFKYTGILGGI